MKNFRRKMKTNVNSEAQAVQYEAYSNQCSDVYRGLNSANYMME